MHTLNRIAISAVIGLVTGIGQAIAGPKPDEIGRLSADLTPMGSERAGNGAGREEPLGDKHEGQERAH